MNPTPRQATGLGLLALLLWSTVAATVRPLIESLGPCLFLAITSGGAGIVLWILAACRHRDWKYPLRLPSAYLAWGGLSFVLYFGFYSVAFSLVDRATTMQLNLVNYLWPALLLLFSIPILRMRPRVLHLIPGIALACAGIGVSTLNEHGLHTLGAGILAEPAAFILMLCAACAWGLFSTLARRFVNSSHTGGVAVFQLAVGSLFLVAHLFCGRAPQWQDLSWMLLAYVTIFPTALGYLFWETGMRHGNVSLLATCSYYLPVTSTLIGCLFLGVPLTRSLLIGAVLVTAGAILSRKGISGAAPASPTLSDG